MKKYWIIKEDKLPLRFKVKFSNEIKGIIEDVNFYNKFEKEELAMWHEHLVGMIRWVSNKVIAWDNIDKYHHDIQNGVHSVLLQKKLNGLDVNSSLS